MATVSDPEILITPGGPVITIRATAVSTGDQIAIPVANKGGTIVRRDVTLVSGTGTTVDYVIYNRPGSTANADVVETWDTAAAYLTDGTKVAYSAPDGKLYMTLTLNAGSDNVVVIRLYLANRFV